MNHLISGKVLTKFFTGELYEGFNNKVELILLFLASCWRPDLHKEIDFMFT